MFKSLRERLLDIELLIKEKNWDKAHTLYKEIEENWENLIKNLSQEEANQALKIINFIEVLLQENLETLRIGSKHLESLKTYNKFR
ncbi:MAG: hypothetical protein N2Z40_05880 [Caldimicrobium sp.]|nr:hypothetical protein [Caldimicrobium sp.]MCX7613730.1 hypothetical protein [Caldimicrobium sp.]MDW8183171.1 hypothetical protein [Caldimicrobium sp.]